MSGPVTSGSSEVPVRRRGAVAALVAAMLVFAWPLAFGGEAPAGLDGPRMSLPQRVFLHDALADGELPLWNPYEALGVAHVAQLAPGLFHPLNWGAALFEPVRAYAWNKVLALVFGALGMMLLVSLRGAGPRLAAASGAAFAMSGPLASQSNLHYLVSNATVPWAVAALTWALRNAGNSGSILTGAALALCFFGGDVQGVIVASAWLGLLVFLETDRRRAAMAWVRALAWSAGFAAIQLLPAAVAAAGSGRLREGRSGASMLSFELARIWELLFVVRGPGAVPDSVMAAAGFEPSRWIERPGLGVPLLACAIAGAVALRRARWEAVAAAACVWLALGPGAGAWDVVMALPVLRSFQFAEKFLPFATMFVVAAAADGLATTDVRAIKARSFVGALGLVAAAVALVRGYVGEGAAGPWFEATRTDWIVTLGTSLAVVFAATAAASKSQWSPILPAALVVSLVLVPLRAGFSKPDDALRRAPGAVDVIRGAHGHHHVARIGSEDPAPGLPVTLLETLPYGFATQFGIGTLLTYHPFPTEGFARACFADEKLRLECARLVGSEFLVWASHGTVPPGFELAGTAGGVDVLRAKSVVPRARLAPGVHRVASLDDAITAAHALRVSPGEPVVVEEDGAPDEPAAPGRVEEQAFSRNSVTLKTESAGRAFLVLNDAFDPGWVARVDGDEVPVRRVNAIARGVWLEPGMHEVRFSYEPPALGLGAAMTAVTLLLALLMIARERRAVAPAA